MESESSVPWVERLFARLQVRYGNRWTRMWEGIDPEAIKADWREQLVNLYTRHPEAIAYGLEHLSENPPTSDQFLRICVGAPDNTPRLPAPKSQVSKAFLADVMRRISEGGAEMGKVRPAAYCAARLRAKIAAGEKLNPAQRSMLAACETVLPQESAE